MIEQPDDTKPRDAWTDPRLATVTDGPLFKRLFPPAIKACCQKIVDQYLTVYNPPRERAALYCPDCHSRIVCHDGGWTTEGTNII